MAELATSTAAFYKSLPAKRVAAAALFVDHNRDVLIVLPTYKDQWELPGGVVESDESPRKAAEREVREELGLNVRLRRLACVDWLRPQDPKTEGLMFIFDGDRISRARISEISLPVDELREFRFAPVDELRTYLSARMVRRVLAALEAQAEGITAYLEDGHATFG